MALVSRFSPPAYLADFHGIPGQFDQWHQAISGWFDGATKSEPPTVLAANSGSKGIVQFFNPATYDPGGPLVEQAIVWNAFPKELLRHFGRERALVESDRLWALSRYSPRWTGPALDRNFYRPQNEYCEWHVIRDPDTSKIQKVTFTSEPPEYWQALFGGVLQTDYGDFPFTGDRDVVLRLYRQFVSPAVQLQDLVAAEDVATADGKVVFVKKGDYNPYNKWNTTHGIMHLCAPPNSLTAEIQLGADATVLRGDQYGHLLVEPDALICCTGYGGPDRNSDPTIGGAVNALARTGAMVTLRNPVGLYIDHIDLAGWAAPDGKNKTDCGRIG